MKFHAGAYALAVLLAADPAAGQLTSDGQLRGTVRDRTGAVVTAAVVSIASPQLIGGTKTVATDGNGLWRAVVLPPGDYSIQVRAPGFATASRTGIRMTAGATLIVDVALELATVAERVDVTVARPVVDVTTAEVAFTIDEPLLRELPTSRNYGDLINLIPGVAGDQAFGGSKLSNGLYVDGVDTTEASEQNPWLRFTQNWLQEVQVVGLGADAEYGLSTGVTAYGIVRSGTNRYAGLGEFWMMPGTWVASNTHSLSQALQRRFASARIDAYWNTNGQLAGPLRTDQLWFFTGVDHTTNDGAPAGYDGTESQQEDDTRAIGKLTWSAWRAARVEGFLQGGRRHIVNRGLSQTTPVEASTDYRQPQLSGNLHVTQSVGQALLFDMQYAASKSPERVNPQVGSISGPSGHVDQLSGRSSVNAQQYTRENRWRQALSFAGTWFDRAARHELKLGVQFERAREQTTSGYPGGRIYLDLGSVPDLVLIRPESVRRGDTARVTLYAQDRFRIGRRITLSPGLRLDWFHWSTAEAPNALATRPVSPRIGVAWDVRDDHATVVRAHYGRFSDTAFSQPALLTDDANYTEQITARVLGPDAIQVLSTSAIAGSRVLDTNLRQPYVDQFVGGVEHQLSSRLAVLGQYIDRRFDNFAIFTPSNVTWNPVERRDPGPDGVPGTSDDGAVFTVFERVTSGPLVNIYRNVDAAWRHYRGGQVVVRTGTSAPWQVQASYTRSRTTGTMGTNLHANAGVRIFFNDNPNRLVNGDTVGYDPTNEAKVLALWSPRQARGVVVSGVYRHLTGGAWGRVFNATELPQGPETIRAEPRGTRRLPAINQLDLRVEARLRFGTRSLNAYADVFNVWNQGVPDSEVPDPVIAASGSYLGVPSVWRLPRQIRLGVVLSF